MKIDKLRRKELELCEARTKIDCNESEIIVLNINIKHAQARKNLLEDVNGGLKLRIKRLKQEIKELKNLGKLKKK